MKRTPAQFKANPCEMKLEGGPAAWKTVVRPFSSAAGLWFLYAGKYHLYRGVPGHTGAPLDLVESVKLMPLGLGALFQGGPKNGR